MTDQRPQSYYEQAEELICNDAEAVTMDVKGLTFKTTSRYREYAAELRVIATEAWPHSRESLLRIAAEYDELANSVEAIVNSKIATGQQTIQPRSN